jgi:myosin X
MPCPCCRTCSGSSGFYIRPRVQNSQFGIRHYAGDVMYESDGFLDKNRDTFREDLQAAVQQGSDFVYELFEDLDSSGARASTARKKPTVCMQFKASGGPSSKFCVTLISWMA